MMRSTCEVSQQDDLARQEATMADVGNPLALLPVDLIGFRKRCHKLIRECGFAFIVFYTTEHSSRRGVYPSRHLALCNVR